MTLEPPSKDVAEPIALAVLAGVLSRICTSSWDVAVLMFTAVLIAWYSIETHNAVLETRKSNKIALMPGLTIRWYQEFLAANYKPHILILSNEGKGCALNPEVMATDDWFIDLHGVNAIYPGHVIHLSLMKRRVNGITPPSKEDLLGLAERPIKVEILCQPAGGGEKKSVTEIEVREPPIATITRSEWFG